MKRNLIVTIVVAIIMAGFVLAYSKVAPVAGSMMAVDKSAPVVPPVKGYAEGHQILFLHTETSAPDVAKILTEMMGSPVLVVPSLANAPNSILANVYVFNNGIKGSGPFGFQPDVFDNPPGTDGYSPLRSLNEVSWRDGYAPRELQSAAEVKQASQQGEITIETPGVVVNMPMVAWPGGRR